MRTHRERGAVFARYVGLELKGAIVARGFTAKAVAAAIERGDANLNRWLNGKVEIPISVACEVAEAIGIEPAQIVRIAYDRVVAELGGVPDSAQGGSREPALRSLDVAAHPDTDLHTVDLDATRLAASTDDTSVDPSRGDA